MRLLSWVGVGLCSVQHQSDLKRGPSLLGGGAGFSTSSVSPRPPLRSHSTLSSEVGGEERRRKTGGRKWAGWSDEVSSEEEFEEGLALLGRSSVSWERTAGKITMRAQGEGHGRKTTEEVLWTVEGIEKIQEKYPVGHFVESPVFSFGEQSGPSPSVCLRLFPCGHVGTQEGHCALYLDPRGFGVPFRFELFAVKGFEEVSTPPVLWGTEDYWKLADNFFDLSSAQGQVTFGIRTSSV
uniref:Uncharacterized protein n=1 Tax=Chromera velia CCMP2878 TaxID=1169474 RepID=A0A0G4HB91_9ALVE|eukprot:Cvel_25804.t1-p1 / transcript=Cvel_25804.t1 / gene=Cvel_25804 / organism=Chromera_velia_CCMP2878 / gene_product=hypothetical protein / transcript_product=hypothetical protein / location=Cvel_scaffold2973:19239-19949(-) / protein_length=237 / sequence_SO=supercontig / SO=protein_coding / is_pseudo=false